MSGSAKFFLVVLSLGWVVPAWWLGASTVTGQWLLLGFGGIAFVCACLRWRSGACGETGKWLLWCGGPHLLFLVYLLAQALNPAFGFERGWPVGRLYELPHVEWLAVVSGRHRAGVLLGVALMLVSLCMAWCAVGGRGRGVDVRAFASGRGAHRVNLGFPHCGAVWFWRFIHA